MSFAQGCLDTHLHKYSIRLFSPKKSTIPRNRAITTKGGWRNINPLRSI